MSKNRSHRPGPPRVLVLVCDDGAAMIWQFHHQFRDGHTECKSQSNDFPPTAPEVAAKFQEWVREQVNEFPPPEGAINMICNEMSEFFVGVVQP